MRSHAFGNSFLALAALLAAMLVGFCDGSAQGGPIKTLSLDPDAPVVDLFEGMSEGTLQVRVVPRDEFQAEIYLKNTTGETITVTVPRTIAAVQILGQFPFGNNNQNSGSQSTRGGAQNTAGQTNSSNSPNFFSSNGNSNQTGNSFFSIPPEKTVNIQLNSVCLEHGKPTPSRGMKYTLVPLGGEVSSPALRHLLATFSPEETDRQAVQAATWFLQGDLSWEELERKQYLQIGRPPRPYFTKKQLDLAKELVDEAEKASAEKEQRVAEKKL